MARDVAQERYFTQELFISKFRSAFPNVFHELTDHTQLSFFSAPLPDRARTPLCDWVVTMLWI